MSKLNACIQHIATIPTSGHIMHEKGNPKANLIVGKWSKITILIWANTGSGNGSVWQHQTIT